METLTGWSIAVVFFIVVLVQGYNVKYWKSRYENLHEAHETWSGLVVRQDQTIKKQTIKIAWLESELCRGEESERRES